MAVVVVPLQIVQFLAAPVALLTPSGAMSTVSVTLFVCRAPAVPLMVMVLLEVASLSHISTCVHPAKFPIKVLPLSLSTKKAVVTPVEPLT